jgi:hypothetical protein
MGKNSHDRLVLVAFTKDLGKTRLRSAPSRGLINSRIAGNFTAGQDPVYQQEQETPTRDPIEILRPERRSIGAAGQPVDHDSQVTEETGIVDHPPGLFAENFTDVERNGDDKPGIKAELAKSDPGGAILYRPKGHKQLHQLVLAVLIAEQDQSVKTGE